MIYKNIEYRVTFFKDKKNKTPVLEYLDSLGGKEKAKILKYVDFLREHKGVLDEPYSKHIKGKIRELRVDFSNNRHRIFYFTFINKNIILLSAFLKKTPETPPEEIMKAENNYHIVINHEKHT